MHFRRYEGVQYQYPALKLHYYLKILNHASRKKCVVCVNLGESVQYLTDGLSGFLDAFIFTELTLHNGIVSFCLSVNAKVCSIRLVFCLDFLKPLADFFTSVISSCPTSLSFHRNLKGSL